MTASQDHTLRLFTLSPEKLVELARGRVSRTLSREERARYRFSE